MRVRVLLPLVFLCASCGASSSSVRFEGNREIATPELESAVQGEADSDARERRLTGLYYDRGYLTAKVRSSGGVVSVMEGPRFRLRVMKIAEVDADGKEIAPLGGRDALRARLRLKPGDWFSKRTLAEDLEGIARTYKEAGAEAAIDPQVAVDADRAEVDVAVHIRRSVR